MAFKTVCWLVAPHSVIEKQKKNIDKLSLELSTSPANVCFSRGKNGKITGSVLLLLSPTLRSQRLSHVRPCVGNAIFFSPAASFVLLIFGGQVTVLVLRSVSLGNVLNDLVSKETLRPWSMT